MTTVSLITNVEMDDETIEELHVLRSIRAQTTSNLLSDLESTLDMLVKMGHISKDDVCDELKESLRLLLLERLDEMHERVHEHHFFDDEIALFSELEAESATKVL